MAAAPVLEGKVAVVTGASRGLGRAIAVALAEAGAAVAVSGRARVELEETAARVRGAGQRALVVPADVTRYEEVEALAAGCLDGLGGLDILVNNSGVARIAALAEMALEDWQATIDTNLSGVFHGCRAAAAHMIARRAGKVINLASVSAAVGMAGYAAYAASKGGVVAFTRALGVEWARHNIQVNAIAPGWVVTDMNEAAFADPRLRERLLRDVPARRPGRPEEVGGLAVYLASPASDFMTGQTIYLDGGHSAA